MTPLHNPGTLPRGKGSPGASCREASTPSGGTAANRPQELVRSDALVKKDTALARQKNRPAFSHPHYIS